MPVYMVPQSPWEKARQEEREQQAQQIKDIFDSVPGQIKTCHNLLQIKKKLTYILSFLERQAAERGPQLSLADLDQIIQEQTVELEKAQRGIRSLEETLVKMRELPLPLKDPAEASRTTALAHELRKRKQKAAAAQVNLETLQNLQVGKESLDIHTEMEIAREALAQTQKQLDEITHQLETQNGLSQEEIEQSDQPEGVELEFWGSHLAYQAARCSLVQKGLVPLELLDTVHINYNLSIAVANPPRGRQNTVDDGEERIKSMIDRTISELREAVFPYHQLQEWTITDALGRGKPVFEIQMNPDETGAPLYITCIHYKGEHNREAWARLNVESLRNTIFNMLWVDKKWWQVWLKKPVFPESWGAAE